MSKVKLYPAVVAIVLGFLLVSMFGFNPILEAEQNRLTVTESAVPEIVGGREAAPGAYPFMGMLTQVGSDDLHCSGTLIDPEWVLTAAHCVNEFDQADQIDVIFGRHDRRQTADGVRVTSQGIYIYPEFGYGWFPNADIALIHLDRPVTAFSAVDVARDERLNTSGRMVTALGWGGYDGELRNQLLHEVEMPIFRMADCRWRGFDGMFGEMTEKILCAGFKDGHAGTCPDDGGSPMLTRDDEAWVLIGVTSVADNYRCGRAERNSVHARVTAYTDWIDAHLNGNPPHPPMTNGWFHRIPDQYEPNDGHLTATTLFTGTELVSQNHTISDESDEDWFTFTLTQSARIITQLTMDNRTFSPLLMTLLNADLTVREEYSIDSRGGSWIAFGYLGDCTWYEDTALPAGTYYIRVRDEREQPTSTTYTISQSREDCLQPDQYEPNDSQDTAKTITLGERQAHTLISQYDSDWLTFVLTQTTEVAIETYGHYEMDTNLALYRDSQTGSVDVDEDGGFEKHSQLAFCGTDALPAGTYRIEVADGFEEYVDSGRGYPVLDRELDIGDGFPYTIEMRDCSHLHEPNDSNETATRIMVGETQTHLADFPDDSDWMTLVLTETTPLVLQVQSSEGHDVSLFQLQDGTLQEIEEENRVGWSEMIRMRCGRNALPVGTYYLLVEPDYSTWRINRYTVSIGDCNDTEPNDEQESGTPLTMGELVTHAISFVDDVDWFTFTLPTTRSVAINIDWSAYYTDLDINLYRDGEHVGGEIEEYSAYYMPYCYENALPPGEYAISVVSADETVLPSYTIVMDECPDTAEPNNSAETAVPITVDSVDSMVEGSIYEGDDEDWFALTLDGQTALYPNLLVDIGRYYSGLEVMMYDAELNLVNKGSDSYCDWPPLSAGTYYIRVYSSKSEAVPAYTLQMEMCDPLEDGELHWDAYEPDDSYPVPDVFPRLTVGKWQTRNISSPRDTDIMQFTVEEKSDVAISLESTTHTDMILSLRPIITGRTDPRLGQESILNDDFYGTTPHIRACDLLPGEYGVETYDYLRNEVVPEYRVKFEFAPCNHIFLPILSMP